MPCGLRPLPKAGLSFPTASSPEAVAGCAPIPCRIRCQIEAGSDFFLMPSVYEPCGLNQIYSLKYGSLPIVHATGGLKETVENYNQRTGEGTGFKFWDLTPQAIYGTVKWAVETWFYRKEHIELLVQNAMQQHFSWDESAREYIKMYRKALSNITVMV
jgi:starch synthase